MSRHRSGKRPWLAAVLALFYPGLGHVYLRKWLRALAWFGPVFAIVALTLPESAVPDSGGVSVEAVMQATRALPVEASVAVAVLSVLNIVDAYLIARRRTPTSDTVDDAARTADTGTDAGTTTDSDATTDAVPDRCPHCGRETDTDLEFCQWCGEPLDATDS